MQSAQGWATKNVPGAIDGARDRRILRTEATASSINLPEYDIERSDDCGNVSQQVATRKEVHGRKMGEGRSADLALVRLVGAIGDEIDAELALRSFHGDVALAGGHAIALAVELEMLDHRLHRPFHFRAWGRNDLVVSRGDGPLPFGQP